MKTNSKPSNLLPTLARRASEGKQRATTKSSSAATKLHQRRRPLLERLEERTVMSSFAVTFGGDGNDYPRPAGATDPLENSYITGRFNSQPADFDPGPGITNLSSAGGDDIFLAKYGPDGVLAWARQFGGPGADTGVRTAFSHEASGDYVYLTGYFRDAANFGPGWGVRTTSGDADAFLLKLDASTGSTVWGVQLGSSGYDAPADLAVENGKVHLVGAFNGSADFDPGTGAAVLSSANGSNFVWTLDVDGNYVSAWQLGAYIASVVVEGDALYVRGQFTGTADFDPGPGTQLRSSTVNNNFWIGQYSSSGTFGWAQTAHVSVLTSGTMAKDASALYIATTDYYQSANSDAVALSFSKTDGALLWSKRFGTPANYEYTSTCVINPDTGALYIGGMFAGDMVDFNPGVAGGEIYNQGSTDGYVVKLQASTGNYQQAWQLGGAGATEYARVHDARGSKIYVSSTFAGPITFPSGQSFTNNYTNDGYFLVIDETDALPPSSPTTKFYVVDDGSANKNFEYAGGGASVENYSLNSANTSPRGAASTAAGDKVWVVDANKKVYVYNTTGGLLGSWTANSLPSNANVQGIATNGTDVWIVDAQGDKVYRYSGAASRLSGSQNSASSFNLNTSNKDATDLVTDGSSIWVLNNTTTDKIFKYTVSGSLLGSWTISGAGGNPTGLTIDPASISSIWIVDSSTDRIYEFPSATSRTSGSATPTTSFALATGNTNPQGIADPPPVGSAGPAEPVQPTTSTISNDSPHDIALLSLTTELEDLLTISKKRK